ncbi:MAG: hypothetical protein ACLFUB_17935 [Cyclobacteriaceae bacterium]
MITLTQILSHQLVDREGASISLSQESLSMNQPEISRDTQPFSAIKEGKFRRLFDRHRLSYR